MIRKFLIILISVFSVTTFCAQETDVEKEGFKGKVKSVTQVNYDYGNYVKGEEWEWRIIKYDSDGNTIEDVRYTDRGIWNQEHTYKYDPDGNKIEVVQISEYKSIIEWKFEYYD